jgi:hypothetical protein
MRVPELQRQVEKNPQVGGAAPQVAAAPQALASSEQAVNQSAERAAQSLGDIGNKIAERALERQKMEAEKEVLAASTDYLKSKQDTLYSRDRAVNGAGLEVPVGLLNRELGQAKDALLDYDKDFAEKRAIFIERVPGEGQKRALAKILDQDHVSTREQILRHETEQSNKDYALTAKANIEQQVLGAASIKSPEAIAAAIMTASSIQSTVMSRMGSSPEMIKLQSQDVADKIVASAVEGNLDKDPHTAQLILDAQKGSISSAAFEKMSQTINGKMLDSRRTEVWNSVSGLTNPDGTVDVTRALAHTDGWLSAQKELPPGQADHIRDFVRQQAAVQDAALKDRRDARTRAFFNEALGMKASGVSFQQAENQLFRVKGYGFDGVDRDEKTRQLLALYTRDSDFYDAAIKAQTPDQKAAWDDIKNMGVAKYGKTTVRLEGEDFSRKASDVFENEMMRRVLGQPAEQMRKIAVDALKNVEVDKKWWFLDSPAMRAVDPIGVLPKIFNTSTEPAYKLGAEHRAGEELKVAALQDAYGQGSVAQARSAFRQAGLIHPTAKDIRDYIERTKNGR